MRIRTGYSFRQAVGHIEEALDGIKRMGLPFAPITDRASTFGFVRWSKLCKKNDIKPVFGVELAVTDEPESKKPSFDYWTFVAKSSLVPVHEALELATAQFRYEALLNYEQAQKVDAIKIVGHRSNLENIDPQTPDLYVALSPSLSNGQFMRAKKMGFKFIASCDNRYPTEEDLAFYEVVCGRMASTQSYPQWIMTRKQWEDSVPRGATAEEKDAAWESLLEIGNACSAQLKSGSLLVPEKAMTLREMCVAGAKELGIDLEDKVYAARLTKELDLIELKQFEDYFYIIADMVAWARERMIVGPARGSSCGSLVCYLLKITTIDPIPYGLIFERFIDINRSDLPDIDIDFSDQQRHLVFEYMENKYGRDRIARLGTVAMYKARSSMQEAGAALRIPRWKTDKALDALIERSSGDSRALDTLRDTLEQTPNGQELIKEYPEVMVATKMEGHPRHHSQHAAGIVLTELPVHEYVAVDKRTGATHCDKKDAEELELLKIDALGLTQLSVFEDALELAGLPMNFLESVPLDDQEAFDVLNKGHFSGIFQFNGLALQSLCKQTKVVELDDIIAITALARPGPLTSGGASEWVYRKNGWDPRTNQKIGVTYPHELFEPYLNDTRGIVLYQEQVMEIGRQIGDLSWEDVTALRKAMSKSLGKEYFDQFGDRWKEAAAKKGIPKETLDSVWDDLCAYGAWAFNKSHSVAYGVISYWCCWLKAHYPTQFAAATLNHETDPMKQVAILRELHNEGIGYVAVDAEISTDKWQVGFIEGKQMLVGPVQNVKGIGPKLVQQIVSSRHRNEPLPPRAAKLLANPETQIDTLWPIADRIKQLMPDPTERSIYTPITLIGDITEDHEEETTFLIVAVAKTINPRDENETIMIARRGYEIKDGKTQSLNLQMEDDTGILYCKIGRWKYDQIGKQVVDRGRPGKSIYAIKGKALPKRRFLMVEGVRYIGDMDSNYEESK
jgi:DNA polymerase III alpha subunit